MIRAKGSEEWIESKIVESLSKYNGNGKENVIPKYKSALSQILSDYSDLFTLYNTANYPVTGWVRTALN